MRAAVGASFGAYKMTGMIRDLEDPQSELFDPLRASKIKKGEDS